MTPVRRQRDARAYIRPLANARCATPATPEGRQRDAIRPLGNAHYQCTLCHACHAKAAETKGHQRRRPNGTRGTPEGRQGVHPTPWQCTLRHACHARAAETKWHQRDARGTPEGRQGVHPSPCQCTLCHACHAKAETKWHQREARIQKPQSSLSCRGVFLVAATSHTEECPAASQLVSCMPVT